MIWIAGIMGGLGIACMMLKKTLIGILMGMQILASGAVLMFTSVGMISGLKMDSYIFGIFIILSSIVQLAVGYSLAIRSFFQKKNILIEPKEKLRMLKS